MSVDNMQKILQEKNCRGIGLDDQFEFRCIQCGKCCTHREDILLTPKDLFRMAKELDMLPEQFTLKYCDTYIGHTSKMPIVRVKPLGQMRRCSLLKDRKCMVHKAKPVICAAYPIGRFMGLTVDDIKGGNKEESIHYLINNEYCKNGPETHTVREWLESFGIPLEDTFFVEWNNFVAETVSTFHENKEKIDIGARIRLYAKGLDVLYFDYQTDDEFMPQFLSNIARYKEMISKELNGISIGWKEC